MDAPQLFQAVMGAGGAVPATAATGDVFKAAVVNASAPAPADAKPSRLWFLVYGLVALISPWLWGITLIGWPILAHVLPRRVDDEGNESRRWRAAFFLALAIGYVVAYLMVMAGFHIATPLARAAVMVV